MARRVLVIEDDRELLGMIKQMLEPEYSVVTAENGLGGMLIATGDEPPDLIISDVMMPNMDGFTMARRLKQDARAKEIPIIFLTARDSPKDVIEGIQAGAKHYITKPFKVGELKQKVASILQTQTTG